MEIAGRMELAKYRFFHWRYELSIPKKLVLALTVAAVTGLLAQVRLVIPWSPVPITGQTFAVLLAGVVMGQWWGGVSMAIYAGLGIAGVPWFTGWGSGLAHLAGPTGGYIIGFILAGLFLGYFTDKYVKSRRFLSMLALMLVANFILIYVPGLLQLGLWLNFVKGQPVSLMAVLGMGALPFIIGDITKAVLAAAVAGGITPRLAFNRKAGKAG